MKEASLSAGFIRLAHDVRLRREHFGGIAFDTFTGNTIEVDRGAFRLLELATEGIKVKQASQIVVEENLEPRLNKRDLSTVIQEFLGLELVIATEPEEGAPDSRVPDVDEWPSGPPLTGPEAVHWAITYRCNAACPDCYAARLRSNQASELSTKEALRLVDRIAKWGAFQLAIGGGEPLLRNDLSVIAQHARKQGLSVHVTTSGELVSGSNNALLESLSCLQIGIRHDDLLSRKPNGQLSWLTEIRRCADELGVNVGANLILCRTVVEHFEEVLDLLAQNGFRQITLLRYKPPASVERWLAESPEPEDLRGMETRIAQWLEQKTAVVIRLDCALAFLERHLSSERARRAGLRGCVAGSRIVALGPDGSVYPCSQLIAPRFRAGNLLDTSSLEVWRTSKILRKCRNRRGQRDFRQTLCGSCRVVERCGGCLALSDTGLGADPGCPEPLLPPLARLGRNGRVADLREYLRSSPAISVGEYMKRYGVGQKRAISELKRFPGLVAVASDDGMKRKNVGKRKADQYELQVDDLIGDIQETIGYTSWGFPCATREQIADGRGLSPSGSNYPAWLLENARNAVTEEDVQTSVPVSVEWFQLRGRRRNMRILSVRKGFLADHSSTSYEFLAIKKPLGAKARAAVSRLSSRAQPTTRRVSFVYHAEGYDLPGGWEPLLYKYYDVMYCESYDWWTFAVAFDTSNKTLVSKLKKYAFYGTDDLGVSVQQKQGRVIVTISCMLDAGALSGGGWEEPYYDEDEDEEDDLVDDGGVATDDSLLDLLARLRSCLMRGECEPLYAVWEEYGSDDEEDDEAPPKPKKTMKGAAVAAEIAGMLTRP